MELDSSGLIGSNPLFVDSNSWDFSYEYNSPCIDAGLPSDTDPDGTVRDIGARWYGITIEPGDCNADYTLNILDVVYMINECVLVGTNCSCGDLDQDNIVNILDVVILINHIIN